MTGDSQHARARRRSRRTAPALRHSCTSSSGARGASLGEIFGRPVKRHATRGPPSNAPSLAAQLQRGKKERPRSGSSVAVAATALSAIARVALGPEPVVVPVQPSSDLPPTSRTASTLTAPVLPLQVLPEPRTPPVNPLVKPSSSLLMADVASEGAQQSAPRAPTAPHRP
jgi:hypothetical protein